MKLKELLYLAGIVRPKIKQYGFSLSEFELPAYGTIQFAQWLHPKQGTVVIEQSAVDELKRFLNEGDVALDIGAHTGDTTVPMALACGKSGLVLALEPNRYVFPVLAENARINREKCNILPLNFAAVEQDGKIEFEYSDEGFCNGGLHKEIGVLQHGHVFKLEVEGKHLLTYLSGTHGEMMSKIRFIKTDCEGYDLYVIKTIMPLIAANRPYLKIEIHKNTSKDYRRELYGLLHETGYDIHMFESDRNIKGQKIDADDMNRYEHFDIFCIPAPGN